MLLNAYYRRRESDGKRLSAVSSVSAAGACSPGSGRFSGTLADVVDVIINRDYGADHSALSLRHLTPGQAAALDVTFTQPVEPVRFRLAIGGRPGEKTDEYVATR